LPVLDVSCGQAGFPPTDSVAETRSEEVKAALTMRLVDGDLPGQKKNPAGAGFRSGVLKVSRTGWEDA
jgi:hypothetical protein